jgi:hypothetical protein
MFISDSPVNGHWPILEASGVALFHRQSQRLIETEIDGHFGPISKSPTGQQQWGFNLGYAEVIEACNLIREHYKGAAASGKVEILPGKEADGMLIVSGGLGPSNFYIKVTDNVAVNPLYVLILQATDGLPKQEDRDAMRINGLDSELAKVREGAYADLI